MHPVVPVSICPADGSRQRHGLRRASAVASIVLLLPLAMATIGQVSATGAVHVVSVTGSDSNAGSEAAPWRTIGYAFRALRAGDTLIVRGGTYTEHVSASLSAGTSSAPILVKAATGEKPVVKGLMWLTSPTWWTFDGLGVTWDPATNTASQHMVKFSGGSNWTFANGEVWGAHSFAGILVSSNPSNWRITGNCIHDTYPSNATNQDHNIYVNSGLSAGPGSIDHNVLFNATNGRNVKLGGPTISDTNGTQNVTIAYNTMYNASQNVSMSGSSRYNSVDHNILQKSSENHLIYGYSLAGAGNVASNNVGFESTKLIDGTNITDGGGNLFPLDPKFDATGQCGAFRPTDATATAYGAYAGGEPAPSPTATPVPSATPVPTAAPSPAAGARVVSHGSTAAGNATTTSLTIARPAGAVSGDLLLAAVTVRGGTSPTVTAPAGWTLVRNDVISTTVSQSVYWRLAGAVEPTDWTWTFSKAESAAGTASAFAGVDRTSPIAASTGSANAATSASILTVASSAARANSLLVGFYGIARATTISTPAGMADGASASSNSGTYLASSQVSTMALTNVGTTGSPTATAGIPFVSIGQLVVLNPAP